MKYQLILAISVALFSVACPPAQAQVGTPRYSIRNRSELKSLILKNQSNSRALYDLATLAHRRGWLGTALSTGDELLKKNQHNAHAQALVAYCINTGLYGRDWNWPYDQTMGNLWKRQMDGNYLQGQSLKLNTPAIRLMAAVSLASSPANQHGEFEQALLLFQQVLKKEPRWADAHFWYGRAINRASTQKPQAERKIALQRSLKHRIRAKQLDRGLYYPVLLGLWGLYSEMGRPVEALASFNAYLEKFPTFEKHLSQQSPGYVAKRRARLVAQIRQQS